MSFLLSIQSGDRMEPFSYLRTIAQSAVTLFHNLHQAASSAPDTWEAETEWQALIQRRKARADEELEHLLFIVGQFRSLDAEFSSTASVLSAIEAIRMAAEEQRPLPSQATETMVQSYFHDRTRFIAGYGMVPEEYTSDALAIDWTGLETLSNFDTETVADFRKLDEGIINPLATIIETRKDALLSRRSFLVHFLGEEKVTVIDCQMVEQVRRAIEGLREPAPP